MRKTCVACHNINKLHYKTGFYILVTKALGKVQNTKLIKTSQQWKSVYVLRDSRDSGDRQWQTRQEEASQ